jgi:hypothetical protein
MNNMVGFVSLSVALCFMSCNNDTTKQERYFYDQAYDSVYEYYFFRVKGSDVEGRWIQISVSEAMLAETRQKARNRDDLKRYTKAAEHGVNVVAGLYYEMVARELSTGKWSAYREPVEGDGHLLMPLSQWFVKAYRERREKLMSEFLGHLEQNRETLRKDGWAKYLEARKFDFDEQP